MRIKIYKINKLYGGAEFIILNTVENTFLEGNSASTAWDCFHYDVAIEVKTLKELKRIKAELENSGAVSKGRK